ncbi:MAG: STAS domain-containing protein [bacterium]
MNFHTEKINEVLVLRIDEKRLDTNVASEFKTELLRFVDKDGEKKILVDLKNVDYVDSSGLGALLFGHRQAKAQSGNLSLVHLNGKIKTLIQIAKLEKILVGYSTEAEAINSFTASFRE